MAKRSARARTRSPAPCCSAAERRSAALAARAFRFIFAGAEVDVVARSVAERDLWLLAVQSLPIGAAYLGKVEIVSKFDAYADTGCEGTAISRRRAKG